jgi:hypothetical protein
MAESQVGGFAPMLTGIAALITAVGGIVFGVVKANEGSTERTAGYAVLSSHVDELIQQAKADHDRIVGLQGALGIVATRTAAAQVASAPTGPPPAPPTEVAKIGDSFKRKASEAAAFKVAPVPRTLPDAVLIYQKR